MFGRSVDETKANTPYPELLAWVEHFRRKERRRQKLDFYLAGVRLEINLLRVQLANSMFFGGPKVANRLSDFLLVSSDESDDADDAAPPAAGAKKSGYSPGDPGYLAASKGAWLAKVGGTGQQL